MTYNGKTVIRMIGKMKGGRGMMCLGFADGGWVYEPIGGSSADSICVKTDEHYRHRTTS